VDWTPREVYELREQRDRLERERDEWANKWAELSRSCVKDTVHWEKKLNEWRTLTSWGGTPEIINDFIKGQQSRIYAAQEAEEQRDRLAEALRELCETLLADKPRDITDLLNKAGDALASVEGGSHDH
jgi:hypothetical protein